MSVRRFKQQVVQQVRRSYFNTLAWWCVGLLCGCGACVLWPSLRSVLEGPSRLMNGQL